MFTKMWLKVLLFAVVISSILSEDTFNDEYVDPIINLLLNNERKEDYYVSEEDSDEIPVLIDGIWKCGRCDNIDESKPLYIEVNDVDTNVRDEAELQYGVSVEGMRCVTLKPDRPGIVLKASGSCSGESVTFITLVMNRFTIQVYG